MRAKMERGSKTETVSTMEASGSHDQPGLGRAVQLPEGGFEHPFHSSGYHLEGHGKEHPRAVSRVSPALLKVLDTTSPGRRPVDMCAL